MYSLFATLAVVFATPAVTVAVAGDSVIVTVALADNTAPQVVAVDSVEFYADVSSSISSPKQKMVAKQVGTTTARFAYPLTLWAPNQTRGGKVGARLGHTEVGVTGWSAWTYVASAWSFTRVVPAPAAPETDKVTAPSVGLN